MERTRHRPVAEGRMSVANGTAIATILSVAGLVLLALFTGMWPTANSAAVGKVGFRLRTESFKKTTVASGFTYQRDSLETVIALRR